MSDDDLAEAVRGCLRTVAPNADFGRMDPGELLTEELDIDSMDHLRFLREVHAKLGVDVPERDYPKLATFDDAVAYLRSRVA